MIRPYTPQDRQKLCDLFAELIENHKEYISHGELQMGIATNRGELAPDFRDAWLRYLDRQIADPETRIMLAERDGALAGFVIYGINRNGVAPYGVIYDVGLLPRHRSRGTGSLLVRTALDALREKGIADCYLESGVDNHSAHRFFEKFGFGQVSCIFRAKL
ncbi:MAG: N-acetyltransferase family protein [Alistipes sp.]